MFVAQKLRKESIAEYLLYMWQIEDIIRAYGCSLPVIKKNYIERFDFTPEQKDEELDWFGNLIRMMNEEGSVRAGILILIECYCRMSLICTADSFRVRSSLFTMLSITRCCLLL